MAVIVTTDNPSNLLSSVRSAIDSGKIKTWTYDHDGDFTHTAEQWNKRAWLRPAVDEDRLVFSIIPPRTSTITIALYGTYHGRFIEMLLNHFDSKFTRVSATALPTNVDRVKGQAAAL